MFFILSKILLAFILPLTWVFGLMAYGLFTKDAIKKRRLFISAFTLLWLLGNRFTVNGIAYLWDMLPYEPSAQKL